jgi:type VI protein secretion system component VasF
VPVAPNRELSDSDSKDFARRWNREIEADIRRREAAARREREGPWKAITWTALWIAWLALLLLLLMFLKTLY